MNVSRRKNCWNWDAFMEIVACLEAKNNAICTNFKLFRRKDIHVAKLGQEDVLPKLISPGNS